MAVLTDDEARAIWRIAYTNSRKDDVKASGLPLHRPTVKAVFQALEDWYVSQAPAVNSAVDAAAGVNVSGAGVKALAAAFLQWKFEQGG